jgi:mono/diheme cytochrome c family protein
VRIAPLQPGQPLPEKGVIGPYDDNAWAISEGQRLYGWYNCSGCHSRAAAASARRSWTTSGSTAAIPRTSTTRSSRAAPTACPPIGGHIPDDQIWKIAAYVRSLSGLERADTHAPRSDHLERDASPAAMSHGMQSALETAGPQAARIAHLCWMFLAVCAVVYVLVMAVLRRGLAPRPEVASSPHGRTRGSPVPWPRHRRSTVLVLFDCSWPARAPAAPWPSRTIPRALHHITGHQWWWQVTYQDPSPDQQFETANEIHIPSGGPSVSS